MNIPGSISPGIRPVLLQIPLAVFKFLCTNEGAAPLALSVYISGKRTQTAMAACDRIWRGWYLQDVTDSTVG